MPDSRRRVERAAAFCDNSNITPNSIPGSLSLDDTGREQLIAHVFDIFAHRIPFNRVLGLEFALSDRGEPILTFPMHAQLVGNFMRGNLHGGVISSCLDVMGGLVAFLEILKKRNYDLGDPDLEAFARMGTIDLRVDYLRPGFGERFVAKGFVLRTGSRVAVTRMELHNDDGDLIAVGTGAYIVG